MLDMGFIPDVERIVSLLPPTRQTLFFSATMAPEIRRLARRLSAEPERDRGLPPRLGGDHHRRGARAGRRARQAGGAAAFGSDPEGAERAHFLQPQAGCGHSAQILDAAPVQRRRAAWRHGADRALRDDGEVQGRRVAASGVQRRRGARASTSADCRTCSISTCRIMRRITCTGSAALAGPGWKATPSPSPCPEDRFNVEAIEKLIGHPIPPVRARGSRSG